MTYSTCSMNPVENEAVLAEVLRRCGATVEIVDASDQVCDFANRAAQRPEPPAQVKRSKDASIVRSLAKQEQIPTVQVTWFSRKTIMKYKRIPTLCMTRFPSIPDCSWRFHIWH